MRRGEGVGLIVGSVIGAFFGRVWLSIAGTGLPDIERALDIASWLVFAAFVIWAIVLWRAVAGRRTAERTGEPAASRFTANDGRFFGIVVLVEVALLFGGGRILTATNHAEWAPVWTLLVVGAHFCPLARVYPGFRRLGAALIVLAVVATAAGAITGSRWAWYAVPGIGGAASLWITAVSGLRMALR
jgi:hypothetical protein